MLVDKTPKITAVEIDLPMAQRLQDLYGNRANIINANGTDTGLPDDEFSEVVSFTHAASRPTPQSSKLGCSQTPSGCFAPAASSPVTTA
ncbi:hypothetical protein A8144_12520 [Mycobacterium leprae 3125609]|nr:hypothetical protein A8144_12520 [Mycobacterium leprae 3125609]OAX70396.1 hypothetical protein A3216_12180 [Mycobacterium leprae 7935681]